MDRKLLMNPSDMHCTRTLIAIGDVNEKQKIERYKELVEGMLKEITLLPSKYDLFRSPQYIIPQEILPHNPKYVKETVFPRSRVLPEEAPKTKWELFAARKGIRKSKNKRGGRVYNEETREFMPAYGRGSKNDIDKQWLIEIKEHEDPMIDRHALLRKEKRERKKHQAEKEKRNIKRARKLLE